MRNLMADNPKSPLKDPFWHSSVFLGVLFLKIAASFLFASAYMKQYFIPFLNWFVLSGFHNPWEFFYGLGQYRMFPYPPAMLWIMALPRLIFSPFLSGDWQALTPGHFFVLRLPLLAADILLYAQLLKFFPVSRKKVLAIYWCSPIIFFINYFHGQLDIIPTAIFFVAVYLLLQQRYLAAVLVLALSVATKTHVMISLPFIWVFLYKKRIGFWRMSFYFLVFCAVFGALLMPYFFSPAFRFMVFNSPEQKKFFDFAIPMSSSLKLIVCPTALTLLFIKFASYKKLNREILLMFLGIAFALLVVFVPPMPGWFLWSLPFLMYFYMHNKDFSRAPFVLYNVIYIVYFLFFFERRSFPLQNLIGSLPVNDLALSIVMSSVGFIALWMFNLGVKKNEELRLAEAPLLIGIGGDSGSGKHTLLRVLRNLVGKSRSIPIFGDNFHKWERGSENWSVYTHLNPSANRLYEGVEKAVALREGCGVELVEYEHKTGKFSNPRMVEPSKFVFFVGLHPFFIKTMRDLMQIKIFMHTEENLRQYWKIQRDVLKRGYERSKVVEQIMTRQQDKLKYIEPQKDFADLVIRYSAAVPLNLDQPTKAIIPLQTNFTLDNSVALDELVGHLSRVHTLTVQHISTVTAQELTVRGTLTAREVAAIASQLNLNLDELYVNSRGWLRNDKGIAQLVFLVLYNHKMKAR